ncbi:enolase C-terminal domain-like protein [Limnohabitans sp. TS-CS-82]|uniref:enolase C-terminal domain-like protein n=1 Tax=Limnohabitans sp. TS-CS-82 TaxID=2094193 RepID=UPI00137534E6|nr:enolase C-terminal domain-like protein [Limnohabitans sp. TS-CS-82]
MKITHIRTTPVLAPLPRPVRTASGTIGQFPLVLIDVSTDSGVVGRAYAQVYLPELLPALAQAVSDLAGMVIGMSLAPRDIHAHLLRRCRLFGMKGLLGVALGGLDIALWDAWARARNEPLARALGADLRPLKAYHSVGLYDAKTVVEIAEETLAAGFSGLKIKAGFPTFAEDLAAIRAAKKALGNAASLMIDYNQSLSFPEAMARCKALDDEGLAWIEEPVLADDLEGCARIADAIITPLQIGENFHGPSEMRAAIAARASDLVMPDAQFIHGVTGWLEASALAHTSGLPMSSHTFLEASAQLLCATPTADWIEVLDAAGGLRHAPLQIKDGMLIPWDTPGIGMEWREDMVARYRV